MSSVLGLRKRSTRGLLRGKAHAPLLSSSDTSGSDGEGDSGSVGSVRDAAAGASSMDQGSFLDRSMYHVDTPERVQRKSRQTQRNAPYPPPSWSMQSPMRSNSNCGFARGRRSASASPLRQANKAPASTAPQASAVAVAKAATSTASQGSAHAASQRKPKEAGDATPVTSSLAAWWQCLGDQFTLDRGEQDAEEVDRELSYTTAQIKSAFKLLSNFERLMLLGVWACLDILLDLVCIVPVKASLALVQLIVSPFSRGRVPLQYFARLAVAAAGLWFVNLIDLSYVYHNVRGQSAIKLYVIFNMCEVFEKLFATFSLDAMDALILRATRCESLLNAVLLVPRVFVTVVPVLCHTLAVLYQILALNVAINSHNTALLTIIISNQFLEIKGAVFKRLDKSGLFQYTCADMRERFQYICVLILIGIRNMAGYHWDMAYFADTLMWSLLAAFASEIFVDIFKHTFITRFNGIDAAVYKTYEQVFANSVVGATASLHSREGRSRRLQRQLGYLAEPLVLLIFKFSKVSLSWIAKLPRLYWVAIFACLFIFKALQRWLLERYCHWRLQRLKKQQGTKEPVNVHIYGAANYRDINSATDSDALFPLGPHDRFGRRVY